MRVEWPSNLVLIARFSMHFPCDQDEGQNVPFDLPKNAKAASPRLTYLPCTG